MRRIRLRLYAIKAALCGFKLLYLSLPRVVLLSTLQAPLSLTFDLFACHFSNWLAIAADPSHDVVGCWHTRFAELGGELDFWVLISCSSLVSESTTPRTMASRMDWDDTTVV